MFNDSKAKAALVIVGVFMLVLVISYVLVMKFLKVDVVFYSSLQAAGGAVMVVAALMFGTTLFALLSSFERGQLLVICVLLGYIFAISVPTVIDRSLSFYILEKLQQRGGGIRLDRFEYIFTNEYMREHRLVDVRLTEQLESGTIIIEGDCVTLTNRGYLLASFGRFFRRNLLPKQRLLRGEYTDQLTDPFSRSDEKPDYLCSTEANR